MRAGETIAIRKDLRDTVYAAYVHGPETIMRPTRAIIHLENLKHNIRSVQAWTAVHSPGPPTVRPKLCIAVKADAYGHGIVETARAAVECGTEYLAVATVDEAVQVREAGIALPLLLYSLPGTTEIPTVIAMRITPLVTDRAYVEALARESRAQGLRTSCHIKVDTGMGRIGCRPEDAIRLVEAVHSHPELRLEGISTHYPMADHEDERYTRDQTARFASLIEDLRTRGVDPGLVHASNSGGVLRFPEGYFDMVRPGILVYGYYPGSELDRPIDLKPVMEFRSKLVFVKNVAPGTAISYGHTWKSSRDTWIGTVPCGYADGYPRLLSNRAQVWIDGRRCPVVGAVCMDQFMIDLGPGPPPERYTDVILFGPQQDNGGATPPDAAELATLCETIPYEITCSLSKRVPRIFTGELE